MSLPDFDAETRNAPPARPYVFCKALLRQAIETGEPVEFTCADGKVHATYTYNPQKSFADGIQIKSGDPKSWSYVLLKDEAGPKYKFATGLAQLAAASITPHFKGARPTAAKFLPALIKYSIGWNS